MKKLINNPLNELKDELKKKSNNFDFSIEEEMKKTPPKVESVEEPQKKEEVKFSTKAKTYRLPINLVQNIEKLLYMNRKFKYNETALVIEALNSYISSQENQKLIEEYSKTERE